MRQRSGEVPRPTFEPSDVADVKFSDAERVLIKIGQAMSGLTDPVDVLDFARAQRQIEERRQRQLMDEISAEVGREKRNAILNSETARLGVSRDELAELSQDPDEYQALMRMKAQARLDDIPTAQKFLADHRRRTAEQNEAAADHWQLVLNFSSKPPRGDDWRRMDKFGPMVAAEITAEKKAKAAFKKRQKADRQPPKPPEPKKPSWRRNPQFKEAAAYFMATGEGIVPMKLEQLNIAAGREADVLNAAAALDEWDARREREGLDYAGFPWPQDED